MPKRAGVGKPPDACVTVVGAALSPDPMERFGRHVLLERRAAGGMGEVFRAAPVQGEFRLLAIKRALPHAADDATLAQAMVDEARIAARLVHPNILPVLDAGDVEGRYFLAMPYVDGRNLHELATELRNRRQRVPRAVVVHVGDAMLSALEHAHQTRDSAGEPLGIIHRDVSPQNILVGFDGAVVLTDFGIARATVRAARTTTGVIKGKVAYLAPEQLRGGALDGRVDLYALAVVLWELLCGVPMRQADTEAELLGQVMRGDLPSPPPSVEPADGPLLAVLAHALQPDVKARFADATAFRAAWLAGGTAPASRAEVQSFLASVFPEGAAEAERALPVWQERHARWLKSQQPPGSPVWRALAASVLAGAAAWGVVRWAAPSGTTVPPAAPDALAKAPDPPTAPAVSAQPATVTTTPVPVAQGSPPSTEAGPQTPPAAEDKAARVPLRRREPRAPAPPADVRPGFVSLNSKPWGHIVVDGRATQKFTPIGRLELPAGRHTIRLVNDDAHVSDEFTVDIEAGRTITMSRTLR